MVQSILNDPIGILGGDVNRLSSHRLEPLYDNWYCEPLPQESEKSFFVRGKEKTLQYISTYPVKDGDDIIFSVCFTMDIG